MIKTIISSALITLLLTSATAYKIHSWRVDSLRLSWEKETDKKLSSQKSALTDLCENQKSITEKVSNDYQKNISDLSRRLDAAHRLHDNSCISVHGIAPRRHDGHSARREPSGSGASGDRRLSAARFIDLIGEGERYRLQLQACQAFIVAIRGAGSGF